MRTSVILFMSTCVLAQMLIAAPGLAQEQLKKNITLDYHNAAFATVVKAIERRSGIIIMYELTPAIEKEQVTIAVHDKPVAEVLDLLVTGRRLKWSIKAPDNIVRLERADPPPVVPATAAATPPHISGIVRDSQGKPLTGATVAIRNSGISTVTNAEGFFTLPAKEGDIIIVTFVSFEPRLIRVSSDMLKFGSVGQVILVPAQSPLDQLVIIAYGTTTRRMATGSVSTVSGEELQRQPVSNALEALEGKAPGLFITQSSGVTGSQMSTSIRGQLSIGSGTLPLFIIDGVPFEETPINTLGASTYGYQGATGHVDPMNSINPADIESISVLKDGDATAIYGSRAANGVILVTTKKGKAGATRLDLNGYSGAGTISHHVPMLNLSQYLAMRHAAFANDNLTPTATSAPDLLAWDTTKSTGFDKRFIGNTEHQTDITAALSGGDQRLHYLFSNTLRHEGTVFPGDYGYNRYSTHLSLDNTSLDGKFAVTVSAFYTKESNNEAANDMISSVFNLPPDYPLYTANGTLNWTGGFTNPLSYLLESYRFQSDNLLANTQLRYTILPGLNAKVSLGYNKIDQGYTLLTPSKAINPSSGQLSTATYSSNYVESYIVEPQLDYTRRIGQGKLTALAGGTWQQSNYVQPYYIVATGFPNDQLMNSWISASTINLKTNGYSNYKYASGFARINYTWKDRYLLNLTGRRDGSSRFGPDHQWGNFGSVGAGWIFTSEPWMKTGLPWLSYGKLRGSYGTTGNDQIADYGYLSTYGTWPYNYGSAGIYPVRSANPNYHWESNHKLDFAIETGFLRDRILASAEWFRSRSGNQLIQAPLASQSGFTYYEANLPAVVQSSGWEFELKTVNIKTRAVTWSTSFNLTATANKLISFPNLSTTNYAGEFVVGQPIDMYTGYHYTGLNNGVATVADLNKDGQITQGLGQTSLKGDYRKIGVVNPTYYGGFSNTVTYDRFTLDVLFQFVKQIKPGFRAASQNATDAPGMMFNQDSHILSDGFKPSTQVSSPPSTAYINYYLYSDAVYSNASFIRLKNVNLSYDLPAAWMKAIRAKGASVFVRGQNLLTMTHYFGFDPETGNIGVPPLRTVVAGIHCSF